MNKEEFKTLIVENLLTDEDIDKIIINETIVTELEKILKLDVGWSTPRVLITVITDMITKYRERNAKI